MICSQTSNWDFAQAQSSVSQSWDETKRENAEAEKRNFAINLLPTDDTTWTLTQDQITVTNPRIVPTPTQHAIDYCCDRSETGTGQKYSNIGPKSPLNLHQRGSFITMTTAGGGGGGGVTNFKSLKSRDTLHYSSISGCNTRFKH